MPDEIVAQTPDAPTEPPVTPEPSTEPGAAPTAPPVAEGEPPVGEEPKETRFQRRINQMTRKIHDLERKLETTARSTEPTAPAASDLEPQEADFADYGQYLKALTKYEIRQGQAESARAVAVRQQNEQWEHLTRTFEPQINAARAKYDDFDEVVAQPLFSAVTQEMLLHSPHGAEIAYFLGSTPQGQTEAMRINALPPLVAAREIVKLEARFDAPPKKTVSAAPTPIEPVAGNLVSTKNPNDMTTAEWMAHEKQQRMERLKAKPF